MNSEDNIAAIDASEKTHFVTTYSLFFASHLAKINLSEFSLVDTPKNKKFLEKENQDDVLIAHRTTGKFWGKERCVVVTYNPKTAAKQRYRFDQKLFKIQSALYEMRSKLRSRARGWTSPEVVKTRYHRFCEEIFMPKDLYNLDFEKDHLGWKMGFRKDYYRITKHIRKFGKNVILTDHFDWSTDEIVRASLSRYKVEMAFRQSKDKDLVALQPIRHWTDTKISCHILTCIMALTCIRLMEVCLKKQELEVSGNSAMKAMQKLNSCLCLPKGKIKPIRIIEAPTPLQAKILKAFDHQISLGGVLQKISS